MRKKFLLGIILGIIIAGVMVFSLIDFRSANDAEMDDMFPLPAPSMVSASPGDRLITLAWQSVPGATSYNIYWSRQQPVARSIDRKISSTDNRYQHTGLVGDTTYYYIITAADASGEGAPSKEVSAVTWPEIEKSITGGPATPPSPPISENDFHARMMNRLMDLEQPLGQTPDAGEQPWFPEDEVPPPWEEWPGADAPTWDPNADVPPPREEWPGAGETPAWSPHDEPPRADFPF